MDIEGTRMLMAALVVAPTVRTFRMRQARTVFEDADMPAYIAAVLMIGKHNRVIEGLYIQPAYVEYAPPEDLIEIQQLYRSSVSLYPFPFTRRPGNLAAAHFPSVYYNYPLIRWVVRTRIMCQRGRARVEGADSSSAAWLLVRAPLFVVVQVCLLLRPPLNVQPTDEWGMTL